MLRQQVSAVVVMLALVHHGHVAEAANAGVCTVASAALGYVAPIAAKAGVTAAGFTANGIAGGSLAASMQATVSKANL